MTPLQTTYAVLMALSPFIGFLLSYLIGWLDEPRRVLTPEVVSNGFVFVDLSERGKKFVVFSMTEEYYGVA